MSAAEPPPRPRNDSPEEVGFRRQRMVRWFDPLQLVGTGVQVAVSALFGAYSDKREIQAALAADAEPHRVPGGDGDFWFDYVADLGDGFESTYTMAYFLAQPSLSFERGSATSKTVRGQVLVMGGDQVYPTATRTNYEERLVGPYKAARPFDPAATESAPTLYAIPGNHDWYDGLTNFMRIFCKPSWIGAWRTGQERSYFALRLPRRWWLWGIDIQFDSYIDEPQLEYFRCASKELERGDRLILVTGKPSWTKGMKPHPEPSYANLAYFEDELLKDTEAKLSVVVSGDLHHYARYVDARGTRHRITSGGGGAYLYPTHHLRERLELEEGRKKTAQTLTYELASTFPPKDASKRLRKHAIWRLPVRNLWLLTVLAPLYFLIALLLQAPARRAAGETGFPASVIDAFTRPRTLFAAMVLIPLFVLFAAGQRPLTRFGVGLLHALGHLVLALTLVVAVAHVLEWHGVAVAAVAAAVATALGAALIGGYLAVCDFLYSHWPGQFKGLDRHANEAYSCQAIPDWKSFLRFRIDVDGRLTIYPIGVERVAREDELTFNRTDEASAAYFDVPERVRPQLIEDPIVCE